MRRRIGFRVIFANKQSAAFLRKTCESAGPRMSSESLRVHVTFSHCDMERKSGRIRRVKYSLLLSLAVLSTSLALTDDFKTINGKEYKHATVIRVEPDGVVLKTKSGIVKVYFVELPHAIRERFGNRDPVEVEAECLARTAKEWRKKDDENTEARERAGEHAKDSAKKYAKQRAERHARIHGDERTEKERVDKRTQERASKEQKAEAILKKTVEEFQAAEHRVAQSYEDGAKGTLSGQVFIATNGGENVKLGARKVSLVDHDAIANLCAGVRAFADAKSDQLQLDISPAQERIAAKQKQITVANEDVAAVREEEQEEKQQANAAAEQAEAAWNSPTCQEDLCEAAVEHAMAEEQQAVESEKRAKVAEQQAEVTEESITKDIEHGFRSGTSQGGIDAAREAEKQAKEDASLARQATQRAREAVEQARQAAERTKQYRLNKASDAADAAPEAVRAAWEATDPPQQAADAARRTTDAAKKAVAAANAEIELLEAERAYYYSDQFLFSLLPPAIETAETDAEGKFAMKAPRKGEYVIAAEGWRLLLDNTEYYYWLQPVSLNGQDQRVQNLSNTNLGGAIGICSLLRAAK
jgi:hypothetical protein